MGLNSRPPAPLGLKVLQKDVKANYRVQLLVLIIWFVPVWILVTFAHQSYFGNLLFGVALLLFLWGREVIKFLFEYVYPKAVNLDTFYNLHREFWRKYTLGLAGSVMLYLWGFWFGSIVLLFLAHRAKKDLTLPLSMEYEGGTRLVPTWWLEEEYDDSRPPGDTGFFHGGIFPPQKEINNHIALIGTNSSGKTNLLRLYMQSIIGNCGKGNRDRAMIHDAKSEFFPMLLGMGVRQSNVRILNIFDARGYAWDMAVDLPRGRDAVALSHNLLPEKVNSGNNEFFDKAVRRVLSGVTRLFQRYAPGLWTLRDIVLATQSLELITLLASQDKELRRNLSVLGAGETTGNVMASIGAAIGELETVAAYHHFHYQQGRTFTLKDWYHQNLILLLGCDTESEATLRPYNKLLFNRATQMLTTPGNPGGYTYFILDELPILGKLEEIAQLARLGRSYGGSLCIAFQAITDLEESYGEKVANSLVAQCDKKAFLRVLDRPSATWSANQIGNIKMIWKARSEGSSKTSGQLPFSGNATITEGIAEQRVIELVVNEEHLLNIPKPDEDRRQGVEGYFRCGHYVIHNEISSAYLTLNMIPPVPKEVAEGFLPVSELAEELPLWDEEDIDRLGIGHFLSALEDKDLKALPIENWVRLGDVPDVELSTVDEGAS